MTDASAIQNASQKTTVQVNAKIDLRKIVE